jgi:hypothetical protein
MEVTMSSQKTKAERSNKKPQPKTAADQLSDKDLDEVAGGAGCIPPIKLPKPEPLPRPTFPDPIDPFDDDRGI